MKYLGKVQEAKDLVNVQYVTETVQNAINALDKSDSAVDGQFVTAVSETDGKISVVRRALAANDIPEIGINKVTNLQTQLNSKVEDSELATVAKTGDVTDLVQQADDVIILYCGTSTELV